LGGAWGERRETVAGVRGGDPALSLAQGTRAPAVVGGRYDRRDVVARREVAAQRSEDDWQPGPAADGDNFHEFSPFPRRARGRLWPLPFRTPRGGRSVLKNVLMASPPIGATEKG